MHNVPLSIWKSGIYLVGAFNRALRKKTKAEKNSYAQKKEKTSEEPA